MSRQCVCVILQMSSFLSPFLVNVGQFCPLYRWLCAVGEGGAGGKQNGGQSAKQMAANLFPFSHFHTPSFVYLCAVPTDRYGYLPSLHSLSLSLSLYHFTLSSSLSLTPSHHPQYNYTHTLCHQLREWIQCYDKATALILRWWYMKWNQCKGRPLGFTTKIFSPVSRN